MSHHITIVDSSVKQYGISAEVKLGINGDLVVKAISAGASVVSVGASVVSVGASVVSTGASVVLAGATNVVPKVLSYVPGAANDQPEDIEMVEFDNSEYVDGWCIL